MTNTSTQTKETLIQSWDERFFYQYEVYQCIDSNHAAVKSISSSLEPSMVST